MAAAATVVAYSLVWLVGTGNSERVADALAYARWLVLVPALLLAIPAALTPQHGFKSQAAFLMLTGASVILAPGMMPSLAIWTRILMAFLIVRSFVYLTDEQKGLMLGTVYWILAALIVLSLATWAMGLGFSYESSLSSSRPRVRGVAGTSGILGYAAAILAPWAFYRAMRTGKSGPARIGQFALAFSAMVALTLSDSRSGMVAAVLGLVAALAFPAIKRLARSLSGFGSLSIGLTVAMLIGYAVPMLIGFQVFDTRFWSGSDDSTLVRFALWEAGAADFNARPLTGNGLGSLIYVYAKSSLIEREDFYYHSALLNYLAKSGLFAGIAFMVMLHAGNRALAWSIHCYVNLRDAMPASVALAWNDRIVASLILIAVTVAFSITEAPLQNIYPSFLFFFAAIASLPVRPRTSAALMPHHNG